MAKYYLIVGDQITSELDTVVGDVVALPLLESAKAMSLINQKHITALVAASGFTMAQVVAKLGLTDAIGK